LVDLLDVTLVIAIVGLLVGVGIAFVPSRRDWFNRVLMVGLPIVAGVVILDLAAIATDFHDADGVFDCGTHCSTWHNVVGWTLSIGALLVLVLVITVVFRETLRNRSR
jgi:hypothetical protein